MTENRIKEIEDAYAEMQRRGWGFTSNGQGFGDPTATFVLVGPMKMGIVECLGADPDPVEAVRKAIKKSEDIHGD